MSKTTQTRVDSETLDKLDKMLPRVQEAYPDVRISRADVLRMVLSRGIDELESDIVKGRVR